MKPFFLIITALFISTATSAQNRYIKTLDGEITLQQQNCQSGGKEATFIFKTMQGGAFGCWIERNGQIIIRWNTLMGANGSMLNTDKIDKYPSK